MFFDEPQFGKTETKADPFSLESLIAWLEKMPAKGTYQYVCNGHCLMAQYFTAMGFENVEVGPGFFTHGTTGKIEVLFSEDFENIAIDSRSFKRRHTFGAALTRAREAIASRA